MAELHTIAKHTLLDRGCWNCKDLTRSADEYYRECRSPGRLKKHEVEIIYTHVFNDDQYDDGEVTESMEVDKDMTCKHWRNRYDDIR